MGFVLELCKALREAGSPADGGKRNEAVAKALQVSSAGTGDELVGNCRMGVSEACWQAQAGSAAGDCRFLFSVPCSQPAVCARLVWVLTGQW